MRPSQHQLSNSCQLEITADLMISLCSRIWEGVSSELSTDHHGARTDEWAKRFQFLAEVIPLETPGGGRTPNAFTAR